MSNALSLLILFAVLFVFFRYGIKSSEPKSEDNDEDVSDYAIRNVDSQLEIVNNAMQGNKNIEKLITDIEMCTPGEYEKHITVKWYDRRGDSYEYSFWINGQNINSEMLLEMAYEERRKLRTLLKKEINLLGESSNDNLEGKDECYD